MKRKKKQGGKRRTDHARLSSSAHLAFIEYSGEEKAGDKEEREKRREESEGKVTQEEKG